MTDAGGSRPIFLLTDFGPSSLYPGVIKAVIASSGPGARSYGLSHAVRSFACLEGAMGLAQAWNWLPPDAVVVAVVDPGVGGPRRGLLVRARDRSAIGPDNGLLTVCLREAGARAFEIPQSWFETAPSRTFHGRDVFAPLAARLALGWDPSETWKVCSDAEQLSELIAQRSSRGWEGMIVAVDTFGNLLTNLPKDAVVGAPVTIRVGSARFDRVVQTYSDVDPGELLVYIGSGGFVEIGQREGRANETLGIVGNEPVTVEYR